MSGPVPDVHGPAAVATGSDLQSRLVMAPHIGDADAVTNTGLISSHEDEKLFQAPCEKKDEKALYADTTCSPADGADDGDDGDDGRVATEDEVRDLLHVVDRIPVRLWVACLAGILERFVWYGATAPLRE